MVRLQEFRATALWSCADIRSNWWSWWHGSKIIPQGSCVCEGISFSNVQEHAQRSYVRLNDFWAADRLLLSRYGTIICVLRVYARTVSHEVILWWQILQHLIQGIGTVHLLIMEGARAAYIYVGETSKGIKTAVRLILWMPFLSIRIWLI